MLGLLMFIAVATFRTDFEGASLGKVEEIAPGHYEARVLGDVDQDKRNRQASWYSFRIDGAKGLALTVDLIDLPGEYNYRPNRGAITGDTIPVYSEDGKTWRPVAGVEYDATAPRLRLRLTPSSSSVWIAHQAPYTNADLARLLLRFRSRAELRVDSAGRTPGGREIPLLTIGKPAEGKRVLWLMFRQHAWESGSSWAAEGAIEFLLSKQAEGIRRGTVFRILPMCDPDGVAAGRVRFNANGYDLNRNWDAVDPTTMPEIAAERKAILDWIDGGQRLDMLVSLHNTETSEYVDGPPGVEFGPLLERFEAALNRSAMFQSTRKASAVAVTTTEGKPGRMSVVQGLYRDRKAPAFLIEQRISTHPKLKRAPMPDDRKQFGAALVKAMLEATAR